MPIIHWRLDHFYDRNEGPIDFVKPNASTVAEPRQDPEHMAPESGRFTTHVWLLLKIDTDTTEWGVASVCELHPMNLLYDIRLLRIVSCASGLLFLHCRRTYAFS